MTEQPQVLRGEGTRALPGGVVTFLLSDVVGSTRLWEANEEGATAAIPRHYELLHAAIVLHNGARPLEQGEGDSVVGVFVRPSDAVAAALDVQRAFADEPWPDGMALRIRVAIHTGEADPAGDGTYLGPVVIRCARMRAVGHGGQTLLSGVTHDLVVDRLPEGATLSDLGLHRLKNLRRPERIWELGHPDLAGGFPPLRSLPAAAGNLPSAVSSFIGRQAELDALRQMLAAARLVTLTGAGGCGKTRLGLALASSIAEDDATAADGVWWIELAPVAAPELVPATVARAFGLVEDEGRSVTEMLADQLAGLDALVVLDNCEHLLGACARLTETLLQAAPGLRVVATSREALGLAGEQVFATPPLDGVSASRLFVERAIAVRPGFSPDAAGAGVVAEICERLDGIPLAIELAAARVRLLPPARIAAALSDRFRLLTGGGRTAMPRQQTLEASVAWSYDLLDDDERILLRRLAVFAGGFSLEGAESVGAATPLDAYDVLDVLSRLVDKSLVAVVPAERGNDRYRLLETIRLYAHARLVDSGEADATRDRHCGFFLELAERAEPDILASDGPIWLARLEEDFDNLRAAMEWADATGGGDRLLRLVTALTLFWELRNHLAEGGRWFARALARDGEPSTIRARALWGATHVAMYGDDLGTAARTGPEALTMAEKVGDEWAAGRALNALGFLRLWSEPELGRIDLARSVEVGKRTGDQWAVADGLKMTTVSYLMQEDLTELRRSAADLQRASQHLNHCFIAWAHCMFGWVGARSGQLDAARSELEVSLRYCAEVGDPVTGGVSIACLAGVEALAGEHGAARERLGAFLARAGAIGGGTAAPIASIELAASHMATGETGNGRAILEPLVAALRPVGLPWLVSWGLSILGAGLIEDGEYDQADAVLREARDAAEPIANPWQLSLAEFHLARLAARRDDGGAEDLHHQALARRAAGGFFPAVADSFEELAALAAAAESLVEAARLFGAADALRQRLGATRWPIHEAGHTEALARLRDGLGEQAFAAAFAEGEALSAEEAVAYTSRARGERKRPSAGWAALTPTELEVAKFVVLGLTNPEIGERLFIGRGTVKTHLVHIFAKLGIKTRSELAVEASRRGL